MIESSEQLLPEPAHVAIIMDGNGRWATHREQERSEGHRAGARAVRKVVTRARERGTRYLTLYAFSAQNWARPQREVKALMELLVEFCENERDLLLEKNIRFRIIGERDRLPLKVRAAAELLERVTRKNSAMQLVIAVSYGGREEIVSAARQLAREVEKGRLRSSEVDEAALRSRMWSHDIPDPELLIRTSGELRISNFLLWQLAYAEIYIDPRCWPDFDEAGYDAAVDAFRKRERRFGGVDAVVKGKA